MSAGDAGRPAADPAIRPRGWHRRLYWWVLSWAQHPQGTWALAALAFAESSFFPVPPDVLLIALCLGKPHRAMAYAAVTTAASVVGGVAGYGIGAGLFEVLGRPILEFYGLMDQYERVQALYRQYDVWAVGIAGLTPIPYKVFTVAAGAFAISLPGFVAASIVGRGLRFFLVAALLRVWGEAAREFIDHHLGILTILFAALLVGGFVLVRVVL